MQSTVEEDIISFQVFGHKPKYKTKFNFNLMVALEEMFRVYQSYYNSPRGNMNVFSL